MKIVRLGSSPPRALRASFRIKGYRFTSVIPEGNVTARPDVDCKEDIEALPQVGLTLVLAVEPAAGPVVTADDDDGWSRPPLQVGDQIFHLVECELHLRG